MLGRVLDSQWKQQDEREDHRERGDPEPDGAVTLKPDAAQSLARSFIAGDSTRAAAEGISSPLSHRGRWRFAGDSADTTENRGDIPTNGRIQRLNGRDKLASGGHQTTVSWRKDPERTSHRRTIDWSAHGIRDRL